MEERVYDLTKEVLKRLKGRFANEPNEREQKQMVTAVAKSIEPVIEKEVDQILDFIKDLSPIQELLVDDLVEDVMVNNTRNIYYFDSKRGAVKLNEKIKSREDLEVFVDKLKLYATNESSKGNIADIHLPTGSRVNIVRAPQGYNITARNQKRNPFSIIDLINQRELSYEMAARLWIYVDGFKSKPANILFGGLPASGKTTILNAMFSFFRPEQRIITIEETYELNTLTQENCVNLETSEDIPMTDLVKNALRMRPDIVIIGEVRGAEANDMISVMNIGKMGMATIHASSTREIIERLEHSPMNVPRDIINVIDVLIAIMPVYEHGSTVRKVVQVSEISGFETNVLLSDLYKFDYRTHKETPILPSVAYRDSISALLGIAPSDILEEEKARVVMLRKLNEIGKRDIRSISEVVRDYYDDPEDTLKRLGIKDAHPVIIL